MSPFVRLLVLVVLALGFQGGIFSSAATARTLPNCFKAITTAADTTDTDSLGADTPMPSCKSMTPAAETDLAAPIRPSVDAGTREHDLTVGWAWLDGILEPPKDTGIFA